MKKDIIIINGPSREALKRSFDKYLDDNGNSKGADSEVFFCLLMPDATDSGETVKYIGKVTGLVHKHDKYEEKSAIFDVYGIFHREGKKELLYRLRIDRYNTKKPHCSGRVVDLKRLKPEVGSNPKTRKKGNSRPRSKKDR